MPVTKNCDHCGAVFSIRPAKGHQRFCSKPCQNAAREAAHIEKTCEQCGTPFVVTRCRERDRRFCSKRCVSAHEAIHGRPAGRHARSDRAEFTCKQCGGAFSYTTAILAEYRRKHGKDPMYCSIPCSALGRRADTDAKHVTVCKNCGTPFNKTRRPTGGVYREQRLCSRQCKNEWTSKLYRQRHGLPEITKRLRRGYILLRIPANDGRPAREMFEHRYVMGQHLGRDLMREETVHHVDGNRQNNALGNLELFSSRHGPGQRVIDKVAFAIDILRLYPEFAAANGVKLVEVESAKQTIIPPIPPPGKLHAELVNVTKRALRGMRTIEHDDS